MQGQIDKNIFPLYGQQKNAGALNFPLFPTNGISLLAGAIGADAIAGFGVTGTGGTAGTLQALTTAGATTIQSSITGAVGQIVQVDVNGVSTTAECRKITVVTGSSAPFTLTLDVPLTYAHANSAAIKVNTLSPFTHTVRQQNTLPSFTVEENIGGYESKQYAGSRANKYSLKMGTANTDAEISADMFAQQVAILTTPTAISVVNESPFVFAEAALNIFSASIVTATNVELDIDTGLKDTYTMNTTHAPQFITPTARVVSGKFDVVFNSLDGATYGFFSKLGVGASPTPSDGALTFSLTHPSNAGAITVSIDTIRLSKYADTAKFGDVVTSSVNYEAHLNLSASPANTIQATVVNASYLPF